MAVRDGYLRPVTTAMPDNSYSFVGLKISIMFGACRRHGEKYNRGVS